jgi:hypothetical protein
MKAESRARPKVVLIEDNADNREVLEIVLQSTYETVVFDFNWGLALQPDANYRFLARDLDTSKPARAFEGNVDYKVSDGRVDIDLDLVLGKFFVMNAYMPLHTKIIVETDEGKEIYKGEITERLRTIANGVDVTDRPQEQPFRGTIIIKPPQ